MPCVVAQLVEDLNDAPPGAFALTLDNRDRVNGMTVACPCGCGLFASILFSDKGRMDWNRRPDSPTLTSAVRLYDVLVSGAQVKHYHGALFDGVWHELQ